MSTKFKINNLAIFSGDPEFSEPLHVNKPWAGSKDVFVSKINKIWDTKLFTNDGPLVQELEARIAKFLDVKYCILMTNGTVALSVLLQSLNIKGEVILPSFTFVSTAHTLLLSGLKPVFCDINLNDKNMSVEQCESLITSETGAIIPTHLWGKPCNISAFEELSDKYNIPLIFDAAHAFSCSYKGKTIGGFGDAEVFSFHATKSFHTAEGGAITCNDSKLAQKLRHSRNFGFIEYDNVSHIGTNAKMSELSAALGLSNLEHFNSSVLINKSNYDVYKEQINNIPYLSLNTYDESQSQNYWYISLKVSEKCPLSRDHILRILIAENIMARRYFFPGCHKLAPYKTMYPRVDTHLENTKIISNSIILLPGGSSVSINQIVKICNLLSKILHNANDIADAIRLSNRKLNAHTL